MEMQITGPQIGDFPFAGEAEAAIQAFRAWESRLLDLAVDNPLETLLVAVLGSAWVFYLAERDVNERVNGYDDAVYYVSTCLSVGYANIFPQTQIGKLVAAVVMIIGPSLSSWVVEGQLVKRTAADGRDTSQQNLTPVVDKLDAILQVLKAQRTEAV